MVPRQDGEQILEQENVASTITDLNPAFLWGYLKTLAYNTLPKKLVDLMANIKREINKIPESALKNVFENFEKRSNLVVSAEGGHIE